MESEILYVCEKEHKAITTPFAQSPTHAHDHIELSIILAGEAKYTIEDRSYTLKAGEMVLFDPGVLHSVIIPHQALYRDIHIGINHFHKSFVLPSKLQEQHFLIISYQEQRKKIMELCNQLATETLNHQVGYQLMIHSLVMQLFVRLTRMLHEAPVPLTESTPNLVYPDKRKVVAFIISYINEHYMHEISLEMFAKDMYLSQVYISKIFKEETGHSPIHFLIEKRLSKAKELLETQDLPINVVSSRVGYEDAYHFSKLFKKYYGYPPSHLKKARKQKRNCVVAN